MKYQSLKLTHFILKWFAELGYFQYCLEILTITLKNTHQEAFLGKGFQAYFALSKRTIFLIIPIGLPILPDPAT